MSDNELIDFAIKAKNNAVAGISNYCVGAALLSKSGKVYYGVNIEEPVIPALSICAERAAFQNAFSNGEKEFEKIAVVGGKSSEMELDNNLVPCGVCLQYIYDMAKNIDIVLIKDGKIVNEKIEYFLNVPFKSYEP